MSNRLLSGLFQFHEGMMTFQKNNNIKDKCVCNVQFFLEAAKDMCCKLNEPFIFEPAVVVVFYLEKSADGSYNPKLHTHMVVKMGKKEIIDPSYELNSKKDTRYFGDCRALVKNMKEFFKDYDYISEEELRIYLKKVIKQTLSFKKYENMKLRENDIYDPDYFYKQLDYIETIKIY